MTNPFLGLIKTIGMFLMNKIHFNSNEIGRKIIMNDGAVFTIFRRVEISADEKKSPEAYFLVRFKPVDMTPEQNIRFSKKPMMVFMGFTGFRSKYWAVDFQTGLCQGLYEWEKIEDAEKYSKSIAMKFMAKRSDPKTVMFRIIDKRKEKFEYRIE